MKSLLIAASSALLLATAFVTSPFVAAWSIREAVRTGDSAYLAEKIERRTVRETLRGSLMEFATGPLPVATAATRPGFWQRMKGDIGRRTVEGIVAAYATPEGLPQLFNVRKFYRENISGQAAADAALPWHERARMFWSRVKRAEFHSPSAFEIEMADRNDPTRRYVGLLELRGMTWRLTELRVLKSAKPHPLPLPSERLEPQLARRAQAPRGPEAKRPVLRLEQAVSEKNYSIRFSAALSR